MAYIVISIIAGLISFHVLATIQAILYGLLTLFMLTTGKNIISDVVFNFYKPNVAYVPKIDWASFALSYTIFISLAYTYNHLLGYISLAIFVIDFFIKRSSLRSIVAVALKIQYGADQADMYMAQGIEHDEAYRLAAQDANTLFPM